MSSITSDSSNVEQVSRPRSNALGRYLATRALLDLVLIILAIIFLIPFYILIRNALMTQAQITSFDWDWLPFPPQLAENVELVFTDPIANIGNALKVSAVIAVIQTIGQMLIASMAGYGLARIPFRWKNPVFYLILVTLMIPGEVTFVPTYVVTAALGWVNTYQGIIVPGLFNVFATFLFRQFYLDFPHELEDAGRVDGLDYLGIYRHLIIPNSMGIIMSLGAISFIGSWNAFLWPLVIGQDSSMWTVQVAISTFLTAQVINLPAIFMGALIAVLPLVIIFLFMQRYIVEGVKLSGIKG